jgi:hypothetical protein
LWQAVTVIGRERHHSGFKGFWRCSMGRWFAVGLTVLGAFLIVQNAKDIARMIRIHSM